MNKKDISLKLKILKQLKNRIDRKDVNSKPFSESQHFKNLTISPNNAVNERKFGNLQRKEVYIGYEPRCKLPNAIRDQITGSTFSTKESEVLSLSSLSFDEDSSITYQQNCEIKRNEKIPQKAFISTQDKQEQFKNFLNNKYNSQLQGNTSNAKLRDNHRVIQKKQLQSQPQPLFPQIGMTSKKIVINNFSNNNIQPQGPVVKSIKQDDLQINEQYQLLGQKNESNLREKIILRASQKLSATNYAKLLQESNRNNQIINSNNSSQNDNVVEAAAQIQNNEHLMIIRTKENIRSDLLMKSRNNLINDITLRDNTIGSHFSNNTPIIYGVINNQKLQSTIQSQIIQNGSNKIKNESQNQLKRALMNKQIQQLQQLKSNLKLRSQDQQRQKLRLNDRLLDIKVAQPTHKISLYSLQNNEKQ